MIPLVGYLISFVLAFVTYMRMWVEDEKGGHIDGEDLFWFCTLSFGAALLGPCVIFVWVYRFFKGRVGNTPEAVAYALAGKRKDYKHKQAERAARGHRYG